MNFFLKNIKRKYLGLHVGKLVDEKERKWTPSKVDIELKFLV